jgi:hypothetical protein
MYVIAKYFAWLYIQSIIKGRYCLLVMSAFKLEEIPYQNWLTTQNCVEKMKILSNEMHLKILNAFNEKFNTKEYIYNPWIIPTIKDKKFFPLIKYNSESKIVDVIEYIELIKSISKDENTSSMSAEDLFRKMAWALEVETDTKIIQNFSYYFNAASSILSQACPWIKEMYDFLVHQVIFLKMKGGDIKAMSAHFMKGALVFRSFDTNNLSNIIDLAVDIAHEVGHQALMVLLTSNEIISSSYDAPVYSGARKANRPAIQSLHSAVALTYMIKCLESILNNFSDLETSLKEKLLNKKLELETNLEMNLQSLIDTCEFTNFGGIVIREIAHKYFSTNSLKGA